MRDLILKMSMSVDGFVAGPNGELDWMFGADPAPKAWTAEVIGAAGLHIMGSRTFRDMAAHWPKATDMFAGPMNRIPKAVFSRQGGEILQAAADAQVGDWDKAYVATGDLAAEIAALKAQDGAPIIAHGGARFARSLLAHDLVDQLALMIAPVALGQGQPLFTDLPAPRRLTLVSSTAFPSGAVAQVYRAA